jgi:hypothetical protein
VFNTIFSNISDGVYPAPSFFTVNSTNGAMTIIKDLREDAKAQALYKYKQ